MNHAEIINLVQQGVQQALANHTSTVDIDAPPPLTCLPVEEVSLPTTYTSANSIISDVTIQTMQQQIQMMQKMMEMMQQNAIGKKKPRKRQVLTKYCHTYGLCNHTSPECRTPAEGHQNDATLQNRMGGSKRNTT